ncbi:restriction endonuclease subunit S [Clostridium perfringens]|uniref:restriction endonuclease subunit S n=1 Tax=Clostridium perfringens TaxID=1502 RepID=UPI001CCEFB4B|nr:restriction endonuclease subunit S [Clostridium perfringens]UBK29973.1 restriction endonuclease subunit S [Clostridium perfringens]
MSRNVPKLRFKGFEDEWKEKSFKDIFNGFEYGMNSAAVEFDGKNRYIRITDIDDRNSKYKSKNPVSPEGILEDKYLVKSNDILFARTGASVGKTYLYDKEDGKLYFAGFLIRGNVNCENNAKFIFTQTKTLNYEKWVKVMSMRSGQPGINSQEYSSYKIKVPSLQEQEKIANFLSKVDSIIEKQEKKVEYWNSYKKGMMQKIFSQKIRFKDKKGRNYPEWEKVHLNKFVERVVRKNKDNVSKRPLTISAQYGLVDQEEFFNKLVASKNLEGYYLLKNGEFAYNKSYSTGYPFGAIKRLDKYENGAVSTLYICFKVKNNINSDFIVQYFESSKWHKEIAMIAVEGARNHGLLNVSVSDFFETIHYIPCLEEQNKISKFLLNIDNILFKENKKLEELVQWKKGLLQQMFI